MKLCLLIVCLLQLCLPLHQQFAHHQVYIEKMDNGKYLIAAPLQLAKNKRAFHAKLSEKIVMPKYKQEDDKHDFIDYDYYPRTNEQVDIQKSIDKKLLTDLKNLCYEKPQGDLTSARRLEYFKLGVCSPVVIVPGILATSLILNIDCKTLQSKEKEIFYDSCGWRNCYSFGVSRPDEQYLLWVGLDIMLTVSTGLSKCFGKLFGLLYNKNATSNNTNAGDSNKMNADYQSGNFNFQKYYSFPQGVYSTWFGNTQKSKPYSQCGVNAVRDLSGHVSTLAMLGSQCALKDYGRFLDMLMVMGYQPGLTMQPLPYDFRYGILAGQTQRLLPQIIKNLYHATGKKVVIVAHSLGTLHTLSGLAFFSNKIKQKMVRHYIPITPPWFGTVSAIRNLIYGDPSYFDSSSSIKSGINRYAQMKFTRTSGSTFDLFLRNAFETERDKPWMKEVLKRIQYQNSAPQPNLRHSLKQSNNTIQTYEHPLSWFPAKTEQCFDSFFKRDPSCRMGFIDFKTTPIFKIKGKQYFGTQQSMTELLRDSFQQKHFKQAMDLWAQTKVTNYSLRTLPAPGVNTSMIFTTLYDTQIYYQYEEYSKVSDANRTDNQFTIPTVVKMTPGDVSVPSFSPLLFIAKWIHEKSNGNHSINVVEYCANYKGNNNKIYSTLACECNRNPFKNQLDCTHPCIISDKYLISFISGILTNSMKGYADDDSDAAYYMSDQEINNRMSKCLNLKQDNILKGCSYKDIERQQNYSQ